MCPECERSYAAEQVARAELVQLQWKCGEAEDQLNRLAAKVADLEDELALQHSVNHALYDTILKERRERRT